MPHICTRCNNVFDSGEDILKGCPNCGWKKFMFVKKKPLDSKAQMPKSEQIITRAMGVRVPPRMRERESSAREEEASQESYPATPPPPTPNLPLKKEFEGKRHLEDKHQSDVKSQDDDKSQEKTLESVKITAPGTYELNLPSLFERDELIMAVKEGTYFIDLASVFKKSKKD
jgi:uncharacterized protein